MGKNYKIKVGSQYRNTHTMVICTVTSKRFFNVEYKEDDGHLRSVHYKTFKKHWSQLVSRDDLPWACGRCGLDCTSNGGSQWLSLSCYKQYNVDPKLAERGRNA